MPETKPSKTSLIAFHWAIKLKWMTTYSSKDQNQCKGVDATTQPRVGKDCESGRMERAAGCLDGSDAHRSAASEHRFTLNFYLV